MALLSYFNTDDTTPHLTGRLPNITRALILIFVLLSPVMYNYFVPEVAGDVRWYALGITVLISYALLSLHAFQNKASFTLHKAPIPLYLATFLAVMAMLSLLWTASFYRTFFYGMNFVFYVGFFVLIYLLRSKQWYMSLISMLSFGIIFNSFIGICQFLVIKDYSFQQYLPFWPDTFVDYFKFSAPPAGTFANKNLAGSFLVCTLPLMFWMFCTARSNTEKFLSAFALTMGSIFFVYTRSRGSWLALFCAILFFGLWLALHRKTLLPIFKSYLGRKKVLMLVGMLLCILSASFLQSNLKGYHSVGESVSNQVASVTQMSADEMATRLAYNINGFEMLKDRPFLGTGYAGFFTYYPFYHDAKMKTPPHGYSKTARPQRMHNDLAQMFVELGLFAGIAWLVLYLFPLYAGIKLLKSGISQHEKFFVSILLTSLAGLSLNSLGDFPLQMPTGAMLMWMLWGMVAGLYSLNRDESGASMLLHKKLPHYIYLMLATLLALCAVLYAHSMYHRNKAGWHLKLSMAHVKMGYITPATIHQIETAYNLYPYSTRIIEHVPLIYTNYYFLKGVENVPYEKIINAINMQLEEDPYGASNLLNRIGVYVSRAKELDALGDHQRALAYFTEAEKDYELLVKLVPNYYGTYNMGAKLAEVRGNKEKAQALYKKAYRLTPNAVSEMGIKETENRER